MASHANLTAGICGVCQVGNCGYTALHSRLHRKSHTTNAPHSISAHITASFPLVTSKSLLPQELRKSVGASQLYIYLITATSGQSCNFIYFDQLSRKDKMHFRVSKMAQWIKAFMAMFDNLGWAPEPRR